MALILTQSAFAQTGYPPPPPGVANGQETAAVPTQPNQAPSQWQVLGGQVPSDIATLGLTPLGTLPATQQLALAISLPLRNPDQLAGLVQQIYDPTSQSFRNYLTPDEFTASFGPTVQDYQAAIAFAQARGFEVTATYPNRALIDVSGSVADIEAAFNITMYVYQHPTEPRTFYAPDVEPSVNASVQLLGVSGLNNYLQPRHLAGSGSGGSYLARDFRAAYAPGTALTGAGQTVGLVEFWAPGYDPFFYSNDISAYESLMGTNANVPVTAVLLDGYTNTPNSREGNLETSADIEMAIAMAPGLSGIYVYEGSYPLDILTAMANPANGVPLSHQLSASYTGWVDPRDPAASNLFLQLAAQGQTFFNGSGDMDAYPPGTQGTKRT